MIIGVYGLGRFGSFWAKELSSFFAPSGSSVIGWSRNESRPVPEGVSRVSEEELLNADVIVLCVAISGMEDVLERIAPRLNPGTLVMDTCSVKVHPSRVMMNLLPADIDILATHPMFGPDSGKNGIQDLPLVFSPQRMGEVKIDLWRGFFNSMGLKVVEISPEQHDREAAYSQGITHFIGRVLGELDLNQSSIGTTGYHNLLDIVRQTCNDPWSLFVDLQKYNPYTALMRKDLHQAINVMLERFDSIEVPRED
ncbi:MAG: prephenate dehydrogenase/arogenate dehydrogenase family protein [Spirochaetaceae bacterium]|nr:prephenate dehydrogenase/arogenate dehydrogenase family protein [Spirochaetaceae bacterium]